MTVTDALQGRELPGLGDTPRSAFTPRPYQREAIESVRLAFQQRNVRRPMIVLPTGAGKTVVFSHLIRRRKQSGRALILAHRGELLRQARDKLQQVAPELQVGMVKAELDQHQDVDVVVGSVQTLTSPDRLKRIGRFSTIVVDEAHHAVAATYVRILEQLGSFDDDGPLTVGVTATAGERTDGVGLDLVFDEIVYSRGILFMILNGYLVDVTALEIHTDLDYERVKVRGGDFTDGSLGDALDESGAIDAAAQAYADHASDRRGVAFTPTIATAESLAARLRGLGFAAEHVSGVTLPDERAAILKRVATGETQVICNAAVLTEGYDQPELSCCLIARPTKSRTLFTQMCGRVLRPHPGKPDRALLINMYAPPEAGLATIADLAGGEADMDVRDGESLAEAAMRADAEVKAFGGRRAGLTLNVREVNLFARSRLRWLPVAAGFALPVNDGVLLLIPEGDDRWRLVESRNRVFTEIQGGLDLSLAQGLGEEQARAAGAISMADAAWRNRPPTQVQVGTLAKMRLPLQPTRGEASDAITVASAQKLITKLLVGAR